MASISDLNLVSNLTTPFSFNYIDEKGCDTGIVISVIGEQSEEVQEVLNRQINARRRSEANAKLKNGKPLVRTIEDDVDFTIEYVACRIVGWEGIDEPWSPQNAILLCKTNPLIVEQVKEHSENLANFTKSK